MRLSGEMAKRRQGDDRENGRKLAEVFRLHRDCRMCEGQCPGWVGVEEKTRFRVQKEWNTEERRVGGPPRSIPPLHRSVLLLSFVALVPGRGLTLWWHGAGTRRRPEWANPGTRRHAWPASRCSAWRRHRPHTAGRRQGVPGAGRSDPRSLWSLARQWLVSGSAGVGNAGLRPRPGRRCDGGALRRWWRLRSGSHWLLLCHLQRDVARLRRDAG